MRHASVTLFALLLLVGRCMGADDPDPAPASAAAALETLGLAGAVQFEDRETLSDDEVTIEEAERARLTFTDAGLR